MKLNIADLKIGESAYIVNVLTSELEIKLLEMGFIVGNKLTLIQKAIFDTSYYVEILDYKIALRKNEAKLVEIEKC